MTDLLAELREHERDYPARTHGPLCGRAAAEIARLQEANRRALAIADERAIEANGVRQENERLREENAALTDGLMAYWGNLFDSRLKYVLETRKRLAAEQTARKEKAE